MADIRNNKLFLYNINKYSTCFNSIMNCAVILIYVLIINNNQIQSIEINFYLFLSKVFIFEINK